VTQFATYVRDHLAPHLRATVEYSNEVWNWGFPQAAYAHAEGRKLWPDEGTAWLQYMGVRASRMCRLWKQVFAGQESRLRCVIAPQTGWVDAAAASLDCPRWVAMDRAHHQPCHEGIDAVAISGYFGRPLGEAANAPVLRAWLDKGADQAVARALRFLEQGEGGNELKDGDGKPATGDRSDSVAATIAQFRAFKKVADARGLELYVYEGGTHFSSQDPVLKDFLFKVTQSDKMRELYLRLFQGFKDAGGTVFNCWGWIAPADPWANAQTIVDRTRPKYRAILEFR